MSDPETPARLMTTIAERRGWPATLVNDADTANNGDFHCFEAGRLTAITDSDHTGRGFRANAFAPGYVLSHMTKEGLENRDSKRLRTKNTPLGPVAEPEERAD